MIKIIITGVTSFLGINTLNTLAKIEDFFVYAYVRQESFKKKELPITNNIQYIFGDLEEVYSILEVVQAADVFIHYAWDGSGNIGRASKEIQLKNVKYSLDCLEIARTLGCKKFIFPGSQAEYGSKTSVIKETDTCIPVSEYGKAKLQFEKTASQQYGDEDIKLIFLRIFSVYGHGDREGTLVDLCVKTFNKGGNIMLGECSQMWNYLYIQDFVQIICKIIRADVNGGIYNVASLDTRELKKFVEDIWECSKQIGKASFGNETDNPEKSPNLIPNIERLENAIGNIVFTDFKEGIMQMTERLNS